MSPVRTLITGFRTAMRVVDMKISSELPFDKIVETGQCRIGKINHDILAIRDLHYCSAVFIYPQNKKGYYALAHFEGNKNPQEGSNISDVFDDLKIRMPHEQLRILVYVRHSGGGSSLAEEVYEKHINNIYKISNIFKDKTCFSMQVGSSKEIYIDKDCKLNLFELKDYWKLAASLKGKDRER